MSFDITSLQKDRCRLILVCRHWRGVVQESASLWTDISGHDSTFYVKRSLLKSADLPIHIHYLSQGPHRPKIYLPSYLILVMPHLTRCRSISLIAEDHVPDSFDNLFVGLRTTPPRGLETLALKAEASQRQNIWVGSGLPQLSGVAVLAQLRRLEIDGIPCELAPPNLPLNSVRSLNLIDVINVEAEQLLEVLRGSPRLERLELGRSPLECPPQRVALAPIHLPCLMALHLVFMPVQVSNFFLTTIHAPDCSELFISSHLPEVPDDVVKSCLFTSKTMHFSPVLQRLLTQGRYKDIDVLRLNDQNAEFHLQFHDEDFDYSMDRGIIRLEFKLHSFLQLESTVQWLIGYLDHDMPKAPIRLFVDGVEEARLMDLIESHLAITHLAFRAYSGPGARQPNPILVHMAHSTSSRWPLPDLEVFSYGVVEGGDSHDEMMLDTLRQRYDTCFNKSGNEPIPPRPLRRLRIEPGGTESVHLLEAVRKILPKAEASLIEGDDSIW
ncbi:hypothetical protein FRC01_005345 [Tulasnella sp. 417]|nr:hypothetical protein FRC01_005345 [Tulasnella sp. 417]